MASSRPFARPRFDSIGRFWPVLVVLIIALLYLARPEKPMLDGHAAQTVVADAFSACRGSGNALPYAVTSALVHYATSNVTPQLTQQEMMVAANVLSRRGPCNFLVYGLGLDSPLWQTLNHGGRTVFLEEDSSWIRNMMQAHPSLESYAVNYTTTVTEADQLLIYVQQHRRICFPSERNLLKSKCKLVLKTLPEHIYKIKWDVILIDAPRGYSLEFPGRMMAIYTSALMARRGKSPEHSTDILLHDVDRYVEKLFSTAFLCNKNRLEAEGKLWHFQIFAEGSSQNKQFCTSSLTTSA